MEELVDILDEKGMYTEDIETQPSLLIKEEKLLIITLMNTI